MNALAGRGEAELVERAQAGDRDALETLLRAQYDRLHALCWRMTGNEADAADATQEALIAITRGLPRFDARARFGTWCYRVAVNACLDELRRRKRRPEPVGADRLAATMAASAGGAEAVADRMVVEEALRTITPEFRVAVVLRDLCGLEYSEIAEVLDVPIGTVRSRLARGRGALADRLGNHATTGDRPRPDDD